MDIKISEEAESLLKEMNEKSIRMYMKKYCEIKSKKKATFEVEFSEYLANREVKKDGYKRISTFSFQQFLSKKYYGFDISDL